MRKLATTKEVQVVKNTSPKDKQKPNNLATPKNHGIHYMNWNKMST